MSDESDDSYLQSLYFAGFLVNRLIFRSLLSVSVLIPLLQFTQVSISAFTRAPIASCLRVSVFSMAIPCSGWVLSSLSWLPTHRPLYQHLVTVNVNVPRISDYEQSILHQERVDSLQQSFVWTAFTNYSRQHIIVRSFDCCNNSLTNLL